MRKILLLALAGVLGLIGVMQAAPAQPDAPSFGVSDVDDGSGDAAVSSPSAWYCPWVEAGDIVDSDVIVASEPTVDVDLALFHPIANEEPGSLSVQLVGPAATAIDTGTVLRVGESPAVVEISNGPAAAASMAYADKFIATDQCVVSVPKIWYLPGGSTKTGSVTEIRLFNPFADTAHVALTAYSEFGVDVIADLEGLDVAGRGWTTIDMEPYLPFRDDLVFTVSTDQGLVIPALVRSDQWGEAMWPGTRPAESWEFPIVTVGELEPFISVMSAGTDAIEVSVDIVTPDGTVADARQVTVDSDAPRLIPLSDLAGPPFGVRLRASAPIAATAVAVVPEVDEGLDDEATTTTVEADTTGGDEASIPSITGIAGTNGLARSSPSWIVPIGTLPDTQTSMWVMNTGSEAVIFTYSPLGDLAPVASDPITVAAGSIIEIPVEAGIGYYGFQVEADGPVTVAWAVSGDRGAGLASGIASE